MAKITSPDGFKLWHFINASVYALQLTNETQPTLLAALFDRVADGHISTIDLRLATATDTVYTIKFKEKTSSQELTLGATDYLVLRPDDTLAVLDEAELRKDYTDKLESGIYLDQGAVLRV